MFEIVDHTADVAFTVKAKTKEELVKDAANALYYIYFGKLPEPNFSQRRKVKVEGLNFEDALVSFLNEIIYLFDAHKLVFSGIENIKISQNTIDADLLFEKFSPDCHSPLIYVKAATYGGGKLQISQSGEMSITVILDI